MYSVGCTQVSANPADPRQVDVKAKFHYDISSEPASNQIA